MNHIGNIIKSYRGMLNMSRAELAENICSEKYVYYIEKGDRTPSAQLLTLFANKLGVDLFDHFPYLDCAHPIEVRKIMKSIIRCRQKGEFCEIDKAMEEASRLPDFKRKPWMYELALNRITYMMFVEQRFEEVLPAVQELIDSIDARHRTEIYMANIYMAQSTIFQIVGNLAGAKNAIAAAREIIKNKEDIQRYANVIITVMNGTMTLSYLSGCYEDTIRAATDMIRFQEKALEYERIHYGYFFLAFALWKTGARADAAAWFKKGLHWVLINHRPMDVGFLSIQDGFSDLLADPAASQDIVREFKNLYGIE